MWILAIDPGSKRTGWALMRTGAIHYAGYLESKVKTPIDRVRWMIRDLRVQLMIRGLCSELDLTIVIEITSGKVNRNRHGGGGAGLAVYGMAVGMIVQACSKWVPLDRLHTPTENEWTGSTSKAKRIRIAQAEYPDNDAKADPGADMADAIAMCAWWRDIGSRKAVKA